MIQGRRLILAAGLLFFAGSGCVGPRAARREAGIGEPGPWAQSVRFPEAGMTLDVAAPKLVAGREAEFVVRLSETASGSPVSDADVRLTVEPVKPGKGTRQEYGLCLTPENARWQDSGESAYVICTAVKEPGSYLITITAAPRGRAPLVVSSTRTVEGAGPP